MAETFPARLYSLICDLVEYMALQVSFEAIMNADMNSWWPGGPRPMGNRAFRCCSRTNDAKVTDKCNFVQCKVQAMKCGSFVFNPRGLGGISTMLGAWRARGFTQHYYYAFCIDSRPLLPAASCNKGEGQRKANLNSAHSRIGGAHTIAKYYGIIFPFSSNRLLYLKFINLQQLLIQLQNSEFFSRKNVIVW